MKKVLFTLAFVATLASCGLKEEFQPVFTGKYQNPPTYRYYDDSDFEDGSLVTVSEVAKYYYDYVSAHPEYSSKEERSAGCGVRVEKPMILKAVVSTSDQWGNFYKSFFVQDETGAIELKVGKNGLYNEYLPGQTVYIDCQDLYLGKYTSSYKGYNGMVSIGDKPDTLDRVGSGSYAGKIRYETSNIALPYMIDLHVMRGDPNDLHPVTPEVLSLSQLPTASSSTQANNKYVGRMVTIKNLTYQKKAFALIYVDNAAEHDSDDNRVFIDGGNSKDGTLTSGIKTWAMSKINMTQHLNAGDWDDYSVNSGSRSIGSFRHIDYDDEGEKYVSYSPFYTGGYSVSHYFKMDNTREFQIRTSGFARFADYEIPREVREGTKTIDVTGILGIYQNGFQLTINSLTDICVDGKPLQYNQ